MQPALSPDLAGGEPSKSLPRWDGEQGRSVRGGRDHRIRGAARLRLGRGWCGQRRPRGTVRRIGSVGGEKSSKESASINCLAGLSPLAICSRKSEEQEERMGNGKNKMRHKMERGQVLRERQGGRKTWWTVVQLWKPKLDSYNLIHGGPGVASIGSCTE